MKTSVPVLLIVLMGCSGPRPRPQNPQAWRDAADDCRAGDQSACLWAAVAIEINGDPARAHQKLQRACDAGFADACAEVADHLIKGVGVKAEPVQGLRIAEAACEAGSARGCHIAGVAYFRAQGTTKDLAKSTAFYERACAGKNLEGCRDLGNAVSEGRGVPVDLARARTLWRSACPTIGSACERLSKSLAKDDPAQALAVVQEGCAKGHEPSCRVAGEQLKQSGRREEALRYFRTACEWGSEWSCERLGLNLFRTSPEEALLIWKKSCERNEKSGCHWTAARSPLLDTEQRVTRMKALCES
ncbi:MAG TPA: tetratricopeptide repeat protein, partial [Archangium sp.]